jgi:hypothetical protein
LCLDELKQLEKLGIHYAFHSKQVIPPEHAGIFRRHVVGILLADWERVTTQKEHKEPPKPVVQPQQQNPFSSFTFGPPGPPQGPPHGGPPQQQQNPFSAFDKPPQQNPFGF